MAEHTLVVSESIYYYKLTS